MMSSIKDESSRLNLFLFFIFLLIYFLFFLFLELRVRVRVIRSCSHIRWHGHKSHDLGKNIEDSGKDDIM